MRANNLTLLTDLYELTMMQGYFKNPTNQTVIFDMFYRTNPCGGAFAGVPQILPNHSPITDASSALTENVSAMNGTIPVNASTPASTAATIFFFMSKLLFFLI